MASRDNLTDRTQCYEAILTWKAAVGLLLAKGKRPTELVGIGTGFLVRYEGLPFLVTALHNLEHYTGSGTFDLWFDGHFFPLEQAAFYPSAEDDLAVGVIDWEAVARCAARIDTSGTSHEVWLERVNMLLAGAIDLEASIDGAPSAFGLLGYPASRNVLHYRSDRPVEVHLSAITFDPLDFARSADGTLEKLFFGYDEKARGVPSAYGLSGSPVIGLVPGPDRDTYSPRLWGVAVERIKSDKLLVAVYVMKVLALLDKVVAGLRRCSRVSATS